MTELQSLDRIIENAQRALAAQDHLDFGRLIASEVDLRAANTADLVALAKRIGCSVRSIHYAVGAFRLTQKLGLTHRDVAEIGWTKLAVVAAQKAGMSTKAERLAYCAGRTVTEVRAALAGLGGTVKTVVFTLNKGQRAILDAALVKFGARRSGRSILDKEAALMKLISKLA